MVPLMNPYCHHWIDFISPLVVLKKLMENLKLDDKTKVMFGNGPENMWREKTNKPIPLSPPSQLCNEDLSQKFDHKPSEAEPIKFRGSHSTFSNFHGAPLRIWGMTFPTNEHAYQYRKAMDMGQHATAERIRQAPSPRQAQLIADEVSTNDRWMGIKQSVMYELLQVKLQQCPTFRHDLASSGKAHLIEDTGHEYWGRGPAGNGLNVLGRLLMTLRQNLPAPDASPKPHITGWPKSPYFRNARLSFKSSFQSSSGHQIRCYNCGERSHTKRTCRLISPLQCYLCSEYGHKRKSCPKQQLY